MKRITGKYLEGIVIVKREMIMKFELESLPRNSSFDIIKNEILRVADLIASDKITRKEFDNLSKISSSAIQKRFGSWKMILSECGLGARYSGRTISDKMMQQTKHLTNDEIIGELQRIARSINKNAVTTADLNKGSKIISASTISNRFGSWANGLRAANLAVVKKGRRHCELDYYENMLNVWTHYGRQPKYKEMDLPPSTITSGAYESKWGKWSNALLAFIQYANRDKIEEEITTEEKPKCYYVHVASDFKKGNCRNISIGLRYKILVRDNFRCKKCGRSPATDLKCELHIDHIIPFSRGGKTVLENLQTTCRECNLGKSNNYCEQ
jgi:hypothetical protein